MTTKSKKPDFHVYVKGGKAEDAPLFKVGAAWNHGKGGGFNIVLHSLPVDGNLVAFPPKEDDKSDDEDDNS